MKKQLLYIVIISVLIQTIFITNSYSASFIWIGTNSSSWLVSGNWSGGGGGATPGSGDNITLNTNAPNNLVLDQNRTVANFTINGDTVDLGTYTLTTTGVTYFNGGLVTNGNLNISGSLCHFGGATIDARTEANCGYYHMNGGTFLKPVILVSTGSASTSGTGNCIFSDSLSITHGGSYYFTTGSTYGDNFQNVTITNNSTREIYFGTADTTFISGNLILNNTSTGGIVTGNTGGVTYLASGKTITIGSSGFTNNYLTLKNFYQLGTTAQTLTLTGTGIVNFNNANFNGNLTVTSPGILLKNSTFNGTTTLTRNGSSGNFHSDGGNVFAELSYTNSGTAGRVRMASTTPDTYLGNVTFSSSGQDFQVAYSGENFFHGNVTINSNKVVFNTSSGKVTFSGGNSQSLNGSYNYPFKKLAINKSANHVTANTTLSVDDTLFFVSKNLITTSTNLLTMKSGSTASGASNSSFVLGPVKKVGSNGFQFPVGKNSTFRKVEITAPSNATDAFTAEYFDTTQVLGSTIDTTLNYVSNCGYWSLVRTTGSSNITPKFAFDSTHCDYLTVKPVHIAFWNGTKWVDKGLGDIDGEYRKTSSSQSSFGYFAFSYKLQTGDDYTMPLSINADSVCEATETILRNKKIWYSFTPDSTINTILINKTLMGSKNMAFIHTFSIYQSVAYAQKELVYKWYYGENDSLQSDITLYANLDTSKSYYIAIEKLVEADDCSFCDDDSTFLNICITNRNQNISVLNQLPPQNPSWSQPPYRIDFNSGTPTLDASFSLPVTPSFTHNVQQDLNGNILFYVVDGTIYDPTGSFVADIECNCYNGELLHSNSEFLIVPVPGNCNQYYLIGAGRTSSSGQGDPKPYYVIYDLSTGDVIGTGGAPGNPAIPLPSYFNNNLHHGIIHFAATPLGANNFRFLFISSTENIFRYKITATGIVLDNGPSDGGVTDFVSDLGFYGNGSASMRSEMEVHSFPNNTFLNSTLLYKIAVPLEGSGGSSTGGIRNFIMIASLDMQGIINSSTVKFIDLISGGGTNYRDVKGLEFSPNGKYLYVNTTFAPYIFYVDVNASTPVLIPLLSGSITNASDFQNSQIEWAYDGKLYMGSGTRMACINNPNDPTTATFSDPAPGLSNLSTSITTTLGYGGATEPLVVFPDQIDGEIYGYSLLPNAVGIGLSSSVACTGQYISLTSNSGFSSYLWNTSQTTQNITVTNSGVYTVVVTDANGCQAKSSVEVSIIDCCTGTVGTLTGNFFSSQLSGFSFYSTLPPRIESGFNGVPAASGPSVALNGTLTIDQPDFEFRDLELTMGENSKIILAPGSTKTLNFENNNYIHGCNDNMWDGIYIEYAQGTLEASDGNTFIEDAKNAIVSNDFGNFQLENVHFNRNWKDLVINLKNASVAHPGRVFNGCKFTCGPLYISADALCYSPHLGAITNVGIEINGPGVVQVGNPSFADNEFDNIRRGIATNNVKKGRIEACNFQNITDAGIYSYNSKLLILGNDFLTSRTGILSTTSSSSMFFGHIITGNTFTDVLYHISDWAGKYHYIGPGYGYGKNFFGDINSDPNDNIAGTYFLGTSGFTMMDNEFYRSKYGSVVLNSGPYGGTIDYQDEGNFYQDCNNAILGRANNSKLSIHCNNFNTSLVTYYNNYSWDFSTNSATTSTLADQGSPINDVKAPAGDRFFNQSYNDLLGEITLPFDYYGHDFSSISCLSEIRVKISAGNGTNYPTPVINNCFGTDPDVPCKPAPCPPPCNDRIIAVTSDIDSLVTEYNTLEELIQTEETGDLLYEITYNGDEEDLSDILLAASPLSDSVLVELSRSHSALTSPSLKNVFVANSILSDYVKNEILNENTSLDSTDKADLMAIQGNYTLHPTLAGLAKQITQKKVNQQLYVNDMIRYYADSDSVDAAVEALLLLSSEANIQTLFSTSIGLNLDETSQEIYNTLSEIETIDPDWMAVQGLLLQLVLNNQTVFDIDSTQHAMLYEIAEKTEASLASANARSILKLVFDEEFEDDIESESRFGTGQIKSEIEVKKINSNQLSLNPNPTINQVTISYNLDESAEMAVFELFDVFGSLIMKKEVPSGKNQFRLQLTELSPGIYLCVIKNNESRFQKKLVITK